MSDTINELKKIVAPSLNQPNYGENIEEQFKNIQYNFEILSNHEFVAGSDGKSIHIVNLPFFEKVDDEWTDTALYTALKNILQEDLGEDATSALQPVETDDGTQINWDDNLYNDTTYTQHNSDGTSEVVNTKISVTIPILYTLKEEDALDEPNNRNYCASEAVFVLMDHRFDGKVIQAISESRKTTQYNGKVDVSCAIYFRYDDDSSSWKCYKTNTFPTLYLDVDTNTFCWKIQGNESSIRAQGPSAEVIPAPIKLVIPDTSSQLSPICLYDDGNPVVFNIAKVYDPQKAPTTPLWKKYDLTLLDENDTVLCYLPAGVKYETKDSGGTTHTVTTSTAAAFAVVKLCTDSLGTISHYIEIDRNNLMWYTHAGQYISDGMKCINYNDNTCPPGLMMQTYYNAAQEPCRYHIMWTGETSTNKSHSYKDLNLSMGYVVNNDSNTGWKVYNYIKDDGHYDAANYNEVYFNIFYPTIFKKYVKIDSYDPTTLDALNIGGGFRVKNNSDSYDVETNGALNVAQGATVGGGLYVAQGATIGGGVVIGADLGKDKQVTFIKMNGQMEIEAPQIFTNFLRVDSSSDVGLDICGNIYQQGDIDSGNLTLQQGATVSKDLWVGGNVKVENDLTAASIHIGNANIATMCPIGSIMMWPDVDPPTGWLPCNGSVTIPITLVSSEGQYTVPLYDGTGYYYKVDPEYYALANILRGRYGINNQPSAATEMYLPNFSRRFPLGAQSDGSWICGQQSFNTVIANSGGENTHTLVESEMPKHTHDVSAKISDLKLVVTNSSSTSGCSTTSVGAGNNGTKVGGITPHDSSTIDVTVSEKGDSLAHNNIPPYLAINYIIRYA